MWNAETLRPEAAMELDNLWTMSVGAIFPDGKRICVNGEKHLFFINVERMDTEETLFKGRDVEGGVKFLTRQFFGHWR